MWWTRLWLVKLSLLLLALVVCGGLLWRDVEREMAQQRESLLAKTQQTAELVLRLEAEQMIEQATVLAGDTTLIGSLEEQQRGLAEPELLRLSIQKRLRKLLEHRELGLAMLVDRDGVVLSRVGVDEARHGDSVAGWQLVQLGLRGYRLDDLYEEGGHIYEVAVAPLTTPSHDRYAGALVVGRPLDARLATTLGVEVAWRRGGQLLNGVSAGPPPGATVLAVRRPGSVDGVELLSWQLPQTPSPKARILRSAATGLPSRSLLWGVLASALLLALGLGLLAVDRARLDQQQTDAILPTLLPLPADPVGFPEPTVTTAPAADPAPTDDLAHMYADFVAAKVRCGESLGGLSFETFCDEILGGKQSITRDQGCRDVYFRVQVKDGRATLRATPVW